MANSITATAHYLIVDVDAANADNEIMNDYMAAQMGDHTRGEYEEAARFDLSETGVRSEICEELWTYLQNIHSNWSKNNVPGIEVLTDFPRSMSMGDYITFDDLPGKAFVVKMMGFEEVDIPA